MKKLLILVLIAGGAYLVWMNLGRDEGDAISRLQDRLEAAERGYRAAGRAAGLSGADTTADAAAALREIADVESTLRAMDRTAGADEKRRIGQLLDRVAEVKRRIG